MHVGVVTGKSLLTKPVLFYYFKNKLTNKVKSIEANRNLKWRK